MSKKDKQNLVSNPPLFVTDIQLSGNKDFCVLRFFDAIIDDTYLIKTEEKSKTINSIKNEKKLLAKLVLSKKTASVLYLGLKKYIEEEEEEEENI